MPAPALGVATVDPEEVGSEHRGLLAPRACADFHDHVLLVVWVLGDEGALQASLEFLGAPFQGISFGSSQLLQLGVAEHFPRFPQGAGGGLVLAVEGDDILQGCPLAGQLQDLVVVGGNFWPGHLLFDLLVAGQDALEPGYGDIVGHGHWGVVLGGG